VVVDPAPVVAEGTKPPELPVALVALAPLADAPVAAEPAAVDPVAPLLEPDEP
jgi:hypothetical protein